MQLQLQLHVPVSNLHCNHALVTCAQARLAKLVLKQLDHPRGCKREVDMIMHDGGGPALCIRQQDAGQQGDHHMMHHDPLSYTPGELPTVPLRVPFHARNATWHKMVHDICIHITAYMP